MSASTRQPPSSLCSKTAPLLLIRQPRPAPPLPRCHTNSHARTHTPHTTSNKQTCNKRKQNTPPLQTAPPKKRHHKGRRVGRRRDVGGGAQGLRPRAVAGRRAAARGGARLLDAGARRQVRSAIGSAVVCAVCAARADQLCCLYCMPAAGPPARRRARTSKLKQKRAQKTTFNQNQNQTHAQLPRRRQHHARLGRRRARDDRRSARAARQEARRARDDGRVRARAAARRDLGARQCGARGAAARLARCGARCAALRCVRRLLLFCSACADGPAAREREGGGKVAADSSAITTTPSPIALIGATPIVRTSQPQSTDFMDEDFLDQMRHKVAPC